MDPTSLVVHVLRSCWDSFYRWKEAHSSQAMLSLTRPSILEDIPFQINEVEQVQESPLTGTTFTVTEYDSDSDSGETYTMTAEIFVVEPIKPHPEYTACMPITRNIMVGDDSDHMPFIPYSDDASFSHEIHTLHYNYLAWQNPDDPDCKFLRENDGFDSHRLPVEAICIQAFKQLVNEHGLTNQQIIDTNVMPTQITRHITSYLGGRRR